MMYFDKLVASLKIDGKYLKDKDGVVKLPFNSEYELYLKNQESRDCVVSVSIDNKDVLSGNKIIIRGNTSATLEGFLENNVVKNRFKFIQLTKEIEEHLGYDPEDSIVRIEFRFTKPKPVIQETVYRQRWDWNWYQPYTTWIYSDGVRYSNGGGTSSRSANLSNNDSEVSFFACAAAGMPTEDCFSESDLGITVKGSETKQDFNYAYIGELEEESHVLILKLSGYKDDSIKVEEIITKDSKIKCKTCGKKSNSEFKFCPRCGTFLE